MEHTFFYEVYNPVLDKTFTFPIKSSSCKDANATFYKMFLYGTRTSFEVKMIKIVTSEGKTIEVPETSQIDNWNLWYGQYLKEQVA